MNAPRYLRLSYSLVLVRVLKGGYDYIVQAIALALTKVSQFSQRNNTIAIYDLRQKERL